MDNKRSLTVTLTVASLSENDARALLLTLAELAEVTRNVCGTSVGMLVAAAQPIPEERMAQAFSPEPPIDVAPESRAN